MILTIGAGSSRYAQVRDSAEGVDPTVAGILTVLFLFFVAYVAFRVWKGLKK